MSFFFSFADPVLRSSADSFSGSWIQFCYPTSCEITGITGICLLWDGHNMCMLEGKTEVCEAHSLRCQLLHTYHWFLQSAAPYADVVGQFNVSRCFFCSSSICCVCVHINAFRGMIFSSTTLKMFVICYLWKVPPLRVKQNIIQIENANSSPCPLSTQEIENTGVLSCTERNTLNIASGERTAADLAEGISWRAVLLRKERWVWKLRS